MTSCKIDYTIPGTNKTSKMFRSLRKEFGNSALHYYKYLNSEKVKNYLGNVAKYANIAKVEKSEGLFNKNNQRKRYKNINNFSTEDYKTLLERVVALNQKYKGEHTFTITEIEGRGADRGVYKTIAHTETKGIDVIDAIDENGELTIFEGGYVKNNKGQLLEVPKNLFTTSEQRFSEQKDAITEPTIAMIERFKQVFSLRGINVEVSVEENPEAHGSVTMTGDKSAKITLSPSKIKTDTVAHEFAHIYIDLLGYNHPIVQKGIEQAKKDNPSLWERVQRDYVNETIETQEKELLVIKIGEASTTEANKSDFNYYINRLFRKIASFFGISTDIAKELFEDMYTNNFKDTSLGKLEEGKVQFQKVNTEKALRDLIEDIKLKYNRRRKAFIDRKTESDKVANVGQGEINKISNILETIDKVNDKLAFLETLKMAVGDLTTINNWLSNESNFKNTDNAELNALSFNLTKDYLETYSMLNRGDLADDIETKSLIDSLNNLSGQIERKLYPRMIDQFTYFIMEKTSRKELKEDFETTREALLKSEDITTYAKTVGAMAVSDDIILSLIDQEYKNIQFKAKLENNEFEKIAFDLGNKLRKAGITDFNWMINKDSGTIITEVTDAYIKLEQEAALTLKDENGHYLKYKEITPKNKDNYSKEDLQYNIELGAKKKAYSSVTSPERLVEGRMLDGKHRKYTEAFKNIRRQYEKYDKIEGRWVKKPTVSNKAYQAYRDKYYTDPQKYTVLEKDSRNNPTGFITYKDLSFVKEDYIEFKNKNKDYNKIMNPKTAKDKLKKEFYDFYTEEFNKALVQLPLLVANNMKGRVPPISKHFIDRVLKADKAGSKFLKSITDSITPEAVLSSKRLDENNNIIDGVPIMYTNSLKDQKRIEIFENKINKLQEKRDSILGDENINQDEKAKKLKEVDLELKYAKKQLKVEQARLTPEEISKDLVESLVAFKSMANLYESLSALESTVNLANNIIQFKEDPRNIDSGFYAKDALGNLAKDSEGNPIIKGGKSNTGTRLESWTKGVLYDDEDNKTVWGQLAKKASKYLSLRFIGGNLFSNVNNAIIARIMLDIEAAGREFFDKTQYKEARSEMRSYISGAVFQELGSDKGDYYTSGKPLHKVSAMMKSWDILDDQSEYGNTEKSRTWVKKFWDMGWAFRLQHWGEFNAQGIAAIAILKNETFKAGNEEVSYWDSHEVINGEFVPLKKYEKYVNKDDLFKVVNKIKGYNQYIQGRYTQEDKAALQHHWLGQLAFHFKKWVFPAIEARFRKRYPDQRLQRDMEGRYRSFAYFLKALYDTTFNYKEAMARMDSVEKANIRKTARELTYFAGALAAFIILGAIKKGLDIDDEEKTNPLLRKTINFLRFQSSKISDEVSTFVNPMSMYQQIKNPIAALFVLKEVAEWGASLASLGYHSTVGDIEKITYTKGPYKGNLKFKKESMDLLPFVHLINRIIRLEQEDKFYIK